MTVIAIHLALVAFLAITHHHLPQSVKFAYLITAMIAWVTQHVEFATQGMPSLLVIYALLAHLLWPLASLVLIIALVQLVHPQFLH